MRFKFKFWFCNTFWLLVHYETFIRYFSNSQDNFISLPFVENSWKVFRAWDRPDFWITPVKSGFITIGLHWSNTGICSVLTLGASLGLIIFTVLFQKSEKQWKVRSNCLQKFAHGNSLRSSDFPLGLRPRGKSECSQEFPRANFSR